MDNNPINLNDVMGDQTHGDGDPVEGGDPDDWIREDGSKSSDNPFELGEIKIVIEGLKTTSTEDTSGSTSIESKSESDSSDSGNETSSGEGSTDDQKQKPSRKEIENNPSLSDDNKTGYIYTPDDLAARAKLIDKGWNSGVLGRGILSNEKEGNYRQIAHSDHYVKFSQVWDDAGYINLGETAKFWMDATTVTVGGAIGGTVALPAFVEGGYIFSVATYDATLTGMAHVYFNFQSYMGTVSGASSGAILLGRGMKQSVIPQAQRLGLGYLDMPAFVSFGNRVAPMMHYNRLWLRYHLNNGSVINVMTNATGNATFYSPQLMASPFMSMELRMLMDFYSK